MKLQIKNSKDEVISSVDIPEEEKVVQSAGVKQKVSKGNEIIDRAERYNTIKNSLLVKKARQKKKRKKLIKYFGFISLSIIVALVIFGYLFILTPILKIRTSVSVIRETGKNIITDLSNKNISNLDSNISIISTHLGKANAEIDSLSFLGDMPFIKGYYKNLEIGQDIISKADLLIKGNSAEIINLLSQSGFSLEPIQTSQVTPEVSLNDSPLTLILSKMPEFLEFYSSIEPQIVDILNIAQTLNPNYIPTLPGFDLNSKFKSFNKVASEYPVTASQVLEFLEFAPELFGSGKKTTYLLVLQNETELRSSGGIISSFGSMSIENGEIGDITLSDIWNLENYVREDVGVNAGPVDFSYAREYGVHVNPYSGEYQNIYGQDFLMTSFNFSCGSTTARVQDSNLYPDINWSMNVFKDYYYWANLYDKERFPDYDHILVIDQTFAENMVSIVEPLEIEGVGTVTSENLMSFVKTETDKPELIFKEERKAILDKIADALKEKFFKLDSNKIPQVADILIKSIYAKDIALNSFTNPKLQTFFDDYGLSGKTEKNFTGDYFHLNEAQNCAYKLNRWVRDEVTQNIDIDSDGAISKNINIVWTQPQIYDPAIDNQYSGSIGYSYRAWVRLFVPEDSEILGSDGLNKYSDNYLALGWPGYEPYSYYDDQEQKEVSENVIQFDHRRFSADEPVRGTDLNVTYDLPNSLNYNSNGEYRMLIQKHPGKSWGEKYNIKINYQDKEYSTSFVLDQDKVLSFKNGVITVENYNTSLDWVLELVE